MADAPIPQGQDAPIPQWEDIKANYPAGSAYIPPSVGRLSPGVLDMGLGKAPVSTNAAGSPTGPADPNAPPVLGAPSAPPTTDQPSAAEAPTPPAPGTSPDGASPDPDAAFLQYNAAPGAAPQAPDPDAEFLPYNSSVASTAGQKAGALVESTVKGASDAIGPLAGMGMGAAIGAAIPGLEPITVPVGAAMGLVAGWYASHGVDAAAHLRDPGEFPEDQRTYAIMGQAVGATAGFAMPTQVAASAGVNSAVPFVQKLLDYAKANPLSYLRTELMAGGSAGGAGAIAQTYDPDDPKTLVPAEILGGFLSPTRLLSSALNTTVSKLRYNLGFLTTAGQQKAAQRYILQVLDASGGSPEKLQAILADPDAMGIPVTSAQKTASPALAALEADLVKRSAPFGHRIAARTQSALAGFKNLIAKMTEIGDPAALTTAAQARAHYYSSMIHGEIDAATNEAVEAARNISADNPEALAALSQIADAAIGKALDLVSAHEEELWSAAPQDIPSDGAAVEAAYEDVNRRLLTVAGEKQPAVVEKFIAHLRGLPAEGEGETAFELGGDAEGELNDINLGGRTTSGELIKLRKRMLALARQGAANKQFDDANAYGRIADGALEDLNIIGAKEGNSAFDAARQFSREKNDAFSRTFASDVLGSKRSGADSISPEASLGKAIGSGGIMGDLRLRELQDATTFMKDHQLDSTEAAENVGAMMDAQERYIRLIAANAIGDDGRVSLAKLGAFIKKNPALLNRFPDIKRALQTAMRSEADAQKVVAGYAGSGDIQQNLAALGKLTGMDSPVEGVGALLAGDTPATDLKRLIAAALKGGQKAQDGLKSAVIRDGFLKASNSDGTLDFTKLDALLTQPMRDGLPSRIQMLREAGILQPGEVNRLMTILGAGEKAEGVAEQAAIGHYTVPLTTKGFLMDMLPRIVGARVGSVISERVLGGTTLVAQGAFAKGAQRLWDRLGVKTMTSLLQEAIYDPQVMAKLLAIPRTPAEELGILRSIQAYVLRAGLGAAPQGAAFDAAKGLSSAPEKPHEPPEAAPAVSAAAPAPAPADEAPASAPAPAKAENGRDLLPLIAKLENSDDDARSLAGATGRYQIMLDTAKHYDPEATIEKLKNPAYSEKIAGRYLDDLFKKYKGNIAYVLANYNASPRATKTFVATGDASSLPLQTQEYLKTARAMGALQ